MFYKWVQVGLQPTKNMADVRVLAPESYYKKRQALIAKIRLNIVPPTSTMSFVRPQDEAHLKAWIEITEFIGTHDLKELCLVWRARARTSGMSRSQPLQ